jgi:NAD+ kinase
VIIIRSELNLNSIGIYVNSERDADYRTALIVAEFLTSHGIQVFLTGDGTALSSRVLGLKTSQIGDVGCVVTLGGDGTLLRAARTAALSGTPIIGINLGNMGYLTDAGADNAFESLERLLAGEYTLEKRAMLAADIEMGAGTGTAFALNDVYVSRSGASRALMLKVEINGVHMDTYQADGILVSTPTGSTAYNLSAGGPVIKPDLDVLAITPVCPHALHLRSAVVASADVITVQVLTLGGALFMDGMDAGNINIGGKVRIRRSDYTATIIKTQNKSFYDILRDKMNWA